MSTWAPAKGFLGLFRAPEKEQPDPSVLWSPGELVSASTSVCVSGDPRVTDSATCPLPRGWRPHFSRGCHAEPCSCCVGRTIQYSLDLFSFRNPVQKSVFSNSQTFWRGGGGGARFYCLCIVFQTLTYDPSIGYKIDFEDWTSIECIEVHSKQEKEGLSIFPSC